MPFKNSIAGSLFSNPSFDQVYIDASREDLTRVAGGPGAAREALPQDLETFLMEDNKVTLVDFKITSFALYLVIRTRLVMDGCDHLRPDVSSVSNNSNCSTSNRN
jgi:hypothetical protein